MTETSSSEARLPIPLEAIAMLEEDLDRSLDGWDACPPKWVSPPPGDGVEGAFFDVPAVVKLVRQLRAMPHTAGEWGGTPFDPAPWQIVWVLAPVFGWKYAEGFRIVRTLYEEIPKKNGKTAKACRLGLVLLTGDGEWGPEVYAAAGSRDQAGFAFEPAKTVALKSSALGGRLEVLTRLIRAPGNGGIFRPLSKAGDLAQGANVHGAVIDELHVHKDRSLIDALEKGTAARRQPLIIIITTANDGDETSIYAEKHGYAIDLAEGRAVNPSAFGVIWAADKDDDPFAEDTWRKANPNYPVSPTREFLQDEATKAKARPSALAAFLRLHLNVRAADDGARPDWGWRSVTTSVLEDKLKGKRCWGGLVTRSAQDLSAIAWVFHSPEKPDQWWSIWRHFLPEEMLRHLDERTGGHASVWAKQKRWLKITPGNVIDIGAHLEQIRTDSKLFDVDELAYDPNGAIGIIQPLVEEDRLTVVPVYANTQGSSLVELEGLVRSGRFAHGGDPVIAWQMDNMVMRTSAGGISKIDPKLSHDVVPGAVAMEIALRRALLEKPKRSRTLQTL